MSELRIQYQPADGSDAIDWLRIEPGDPSWGVDVALGAERSVAVRPEDVLNVTHEEAAEIHAANSAFALRPERKPADGEGAE